MCRTVAAHARFPCPRRSGRADGVTPHTRMNLGFTNTLKTWTLLAALGGLLVAVGGLLGGTSGMVLALVFAIAMNGFVYWTSDKLALKANGARPLGPGEEPRLREIVAGLAQRAGDPRPPDLHRRAAGAERLRDRPQPQPLGHRRDDGPPVDHG